MTQVVLNEDFLAKSGGWAAMKEARSILAADRVLSSRWNAPLLNGVVQEGSTTYKCGLVIKGPVDIDNICPCRTSRQHGVICGHSLAVGLHALGLRPEPKPATSPTPSPNTAAPKPARPIRAIQRGNGEVVRIHVVFPPNFEASLSQGRCSVFFEGEWSNGRIPLASLPVDRPFRFEEADVRLLDAAEKLAGGDTPSTLAVSIQALAELLIGLENHPRIRLGRDGTVKVKAASSSFQVRAALQADGCIQLRMTGNAPVGTPVFGKRRFVYRDKCFERLPELDGFETLLQGKSVTISRQAVPLFLNQSWPTLNAAFKVEADFKLEDFEVSVAKPVIRLELAGGLGNLQARLFAYYGQEKVMLDGKPAAAFWIPDPSNSKRYLTRDAEAEQSAQTRMTRVGFTGPHGEGQYQLVGQDSVLQFFARDYGRMEKEWQVTMEERLLQSSSKNIERIQPSFQITPSGEQWFDLSVNYATAGGQVFSPAEIQRLLRSGQSHTRLANGKFALLDTGAVEEFQEVLQDCSPRQNESSYRIHSIQAGFLSASIGGNPSWKTNAPESWRQEAARQNGQIQLDPPPLGDLEGVLRPYQRHGVGWMKFLRQNRFGGILADEMGLGKTLQTLAHLSAALGARHGSTKPCLIICPTSVVHNWMAEARRFTPHLKALLLHGPRRQESFDQIRASDLVITSYALVRRDEAAHRGVEYDTIVLDEAQHIKNRQTENARAVKALRSDHRMVLTGTPLENSVLDLWSIFDFLMPGYLGSASDFKERYEVPIARERDAASMSRLSRRVRPFLLRRLKRDVAKDLPEKLEQVAWCELTPGQQQIYQQILEAGRKEVTEAVQGQGLQKSRMVILSALLRLRQICCDLRLLKLEQEKIADPSGKMEHFGELLDEILDGGHRALVFSQFTTMLHLIEDELETRGVEYCYLDGSTTDRAAVVDRFQNNSSIPVFLISLKAGGVGLNLTGADTVIHFDPWWNPAVEDQATGRAHRIGQTRTVTSYKLITRGTVEEKILNLQARKREIIEKTIDGEERFTENLGWEEIQELFS